ncbi:MAG TPA: DUF2141 domain-containing protein, partial [Chitinophagales bacterium]|nr:DUF2141 domain-containing protein [Chitinophagales bacterium]
MSITYNFDKEEDATYHLEIPDSAYQDILGTWNKKYSYKFKTTTKDNFGNIILTLKTEQPQKHFIVRLLNTNDEVIKEIPFSGDTLQKINIPNLPVGNYHVSAIDDRNNNGKWDTGNLLKGIQPEKVISYKETYTLKGEWDLDIEVKL